jgi:hypothetical protein
MVPVAVMAVEMVPYCGFSVFSRRVVFSSLNFQNQKLVPIAAITNIHIIHFIFFMVSCFIR